MNFKEKAVLFLATGLKTGDIPFAPGTMGTVLGLPLCFFLSQIDVSIAAFGSVIFIFLAIWISGRAQKILKLDDPGCIVVDEISGIMIALLGIPFNLFNMVLGFFIFRGIDIFKPFPIRYLENKISGGLGIVIDDVVAGIYSNLIIRFFLYLNWSF